MRFPAIAFVSILLASCGGAESPADRLQGSWIVSQPDPCTLGLHFGDGKMVLMTMCVNGNDAKAEARVGPFSATDSKITGSFTQATCPVAPGERTFDFTYSWSGASLVVSDPTASLVLEKDTATGGGGTITYGCFDDNGVFTPMPISPL